MSAEKAKRPNLRYYSCMAIQPICDKCGKELIEFGAILLSPPDTEDTVTKFHVCTECYEEIMSEFEH